jgi:serine/threonine-protein kinase
VLGPAPRLVLAMALHRSGQTAEAREALAAAVAGHNWNPAIVRDQDGWICYVLRREAEALLLSDMPATPGRQVPAER